MNLHELTARARAGQIEGANLVCLEGGAYLIEARVGSRLLPLLDAEGQLLKVLSLEQARDLLKGVPMTLELEQADASEEMCGLRETPLRNHPAG
ncbi:DUF6482 family protein [Pseudomonas sp. RL]|uniref:DUF6482 family protein n=1 Tax=Pseudomonas sp. RL TaxID=1452718 RepID=UPI0004866F1A|nr:DUF6482 family protein [Pseudomonas sp. RL]